MVIGRAEEEARADCHIWGCGLRVDKSEIMAELQVEMLPIVGVSCIILYKS